MSDVTYSGRLPGPAVLARRAKRRGVWFVAEYILRQERAFAFSLLIYAVGQPLLYLIAMGVGLGALVGSSPVLGVPYVIFVAPAILISTIVMSASGENTYPIMGGFKWNRLYYGPLATPVSPAQIALGHALGIAIRFVIQATIFWAIMLAFRAAPSGWSFLIIPIAVLTAVAFGAPLQAFAATREDEGAAFAFVQRFVVMPMFLFAGTFFPLESMPIYLRWIGWISPIWHGTQLGRIVSYGLAYPGWLAALHVVVLLAYAGVGLALGTRVYRRRLGA